MLPTRSDIGRVLAALCAAALATACAVDTPSANGVTAPLPPLAEDPTESVIGAPGTPTAPVLVFADEFDAPTLDTSRWMAFDGDPVHKFTLNSASPALVVPRAGSLFLEAAKAPADAAFPYATGYVDTHGRFAQTYGTIEFRARCTYAPGVWYAMWGRAWADLVPEVDFEFLADNTTQAWLVNHWGVPPVPADERRGVTTVNGTDISVFHTYTVVWTPEVLEWRIDGQAYRRLTGNQVPHTPMFWIMNAWVGGWGGTPGTSTRFPAALEVDYVRIHRLAAWQVPPAIRIADPRARYDRSASISVEVADFDPTVKVDVSEDGRQLVVLDRPPFVLPVSLLDRGAHTLVVHASDGAREASVEFTLEAR